MAALQHRSGVYRVLFQFAGKQHSYPIGKVPLPEARQWKAKIEHILMRIKQNLLDLPPSCSIIQFIQHDGKPPAELDSAKPRHTTFDELRQAYLKAFANGAIEANTLRTVKVHLNHIADTIGELFLLPALTLTKLQEHIDRRCQSVKAVTVTKEIHTFRAVWNWGKTRGLVAGAFPSRGLVFPKGKEKSPFMSWEEIDRRVKAGGDADELWDCLYLVPKDVKGFLEFAKKNQNADYLYPMLVACAHCGARRSELMRAECEDVDLANNFFTLREKKRARGKLTTRRVPISTLLANALKEQLDHQQGKKYLFGGGSMELTDSQANRAFSILVEKSKWQVLKGYHILRHAFISALASRGVDQRVIDEFVGHSTEEQRRRYRHLFPKTTQSAIRSVFG